MNYFYMHKTHDERCIKIRASLNHNSHDDFIKHMVCFKIVDEFQLEIPRTCVIKLLPQYDWDSQLIATMFRIELPNDLVRRTAADYINYAVKELKKKL